MSAPDDITQQLNNALHLACITGDRPACPLCEAAVAAREDIQRLQASSDEYAELLQRLSGLLSATATALKGDPGTSTLHDWSDLPVVATKAVTARNAAIFAVQCFVKTGDTESMRDFLTAGGFSIEPDHSLIGGTDV